MRNFYARVRKILKSGTRQTALKCAESADPRWFEPDELTLKAMSQLTSANTRTISRLAAQVVVMTQLIDVLMTTLPAEAAVPAIQSFRDQIEEFMSLMDDVSLPSDYHSALLSEVNLQLRALQEKGAS